MFGERIQAARHAAGLTTRELGVQAGVSAMSISKYENGKAMPSSDILLRLAQALSVRSEYFFRKTEARLENLEFRKHPKLSAPLQRQIEANALEQVERFLELLARFPDPPVNRFKQPALKTDHIACMDEVEAVAEHVRKAWKLGDNPIPDLADTFEQQGIRVFQTNLAGGESFAGLAARVDGMPVVVVSNLDPGDRQRFTLAHELGHLVLSNVTLDKGLDSERVANRFAGAFLVPRAAAWARLGQHRRRLEVRELANLKSEFGLSMAGWLHRAEELGIISSTRYKEMRKMFKVKGWERTEPFEAYPKERLRVMQTLVLRALAEDLVSESKAAELLGVSVVSFRKWMSGGDVDLGRQ